MRTRRDGEIFAAKMQAAQDRAYDEAIKKGNKEGLWILLTTIGAALLGWFGAIWLHSVW